VNDRELFTSLLFSHKHLWIAFQEQKHLREFPDEDLLEVHVRFDDAACEVYRPLEAALLSGQPVQDALQTVLLVTQISRVEGRQM
jgi:hypothetical protein